MPALKDSSKVDVIVVGAGPSGLMLAGELRLSGVSVVVLEKLPEPTGQSRGLGFSAVTTSIFDQRGVLSRFGPIEVGTDGHFGGLPVMSVRWGDQPAAKTVPQSRTEEVLADWATELGADLRRGHEVHGVLDSTVFDGTVFDGAVPDPSGAVEVDCVGPAGRYRLSARCVVGCDGGRSTVRKQLGFDFPGTESSTELLLADVTGLDVAPRMTGESGSGGMVMSARLPGGVTRLIICEREAAPRRRSCAPEFAEVVAAWKRLTGDDISGGEAVWVSAFGDTARLVTEYRRGRVLLAGDAAHVHLPAGGQGMNTGIQDAVNLGWKLGAVIRGRASAALLDSYHAERHPVGQRLIMNTRAQGLLLLGGAELAPLRQLIGELLDYPEVAGHLAGMVSGLEIRYDFGGGDHPLLGRRAPNVEQLGPVGSSVLALRRGRGVLLDLVDNPRLRARAAGWTDRVDIHTAPAAAEAAAALPPGTSALLLRPDGYVAWAAPGTHPDLPMALERWFGPSR